MKEWSQQPQGTNPCHSRFVPEVDVVQNKLFPFLAATKIKESIRLNQSKSCLLLMFSLEALEIIKNN